MGKKVTGNQCPTAAGSLPTLHSSPFIFVCSHLDMGDVGGESHGSAMAQELCTGSSMNGLFCLMFAGEGVWAGWCEGGVE